MDINKTEVGKRIFTIRKSLGLTMKEFGERIGNPAASDSIVSRWEKGVSIPNNERLKRIAELGEISVEELLYGNYEARIRNILMDQESNEDVAQVVQLVINKFTNIDHKYPTREELLNDYNDVVSLINGTREKNQSRITLATNLYNAEKDLMQYLDDRNNFDLIESVNKEIKSAIEQYNIYFDKNISEVLNEIDLINNTDN